MTVLSKLGKRTRVIECDVGRYEIESESILGFDVEVHKVYNKDEKLAFSALLLPQQDSESEDDVAAFETWMTDLAPNFYKGRQDEPFLSCDPRLDQKPSFDAALLPDEARALGCTIARILIFHGKSEMTHHYDMPGWHGMAKTFLKYGGEFVRHGDDWMPHIAIKHDGFWLYSMVADAFLSSVDIATGYGKDGMGKHWAGTRDGTPAFSIKIHLYDAPGKPRFEIAKEEQMIAMLEKAIGWKLHEKEARPLMTEEEMEAQGVSIRSCRGARGGATAAAIWEQITTLKEAHPGQPLPPAIASWKAKSGAVAIANLWNEVHELQATRTPLPKHLADYYDRSRRRAPKATPSSMQLLPGMPPMPIPGTRSKICKCMFCGKEKIYKKPCGSCKM